MSLLISVLSSHDAWAIKHSSVMNDTFSQILLFVFFFVTKWTTHPIIKDVTYFFFLIKFTLGLVFERVYSARLWNVYTRRSHRCYNKTLLYSAVYCFEHSLLKRLKGLGTSSNNLLVPLLKLLQAVMQIE